MCVLSVEGWGKDCIHLAADSHHCLFFSLQTFSPFVTCQSFQSKGEKMKDSAIGTHQSNETNKMERKGEKTEGDQCEMVTKRGLIDQHTDSDQQLNRLR